jgi:hypothetical protein
VDYEGHGLRSSGFPVPEPVVVPERVAIRLLKSDVVEGVGDAGASEWIQPPRETGFLVGIPALSLTFGSPVMVDPVAVVAWIRRVSQYDGAVTVGSWVNPGTRGQWTPDATPTFATNTHISTSPRVTLSALPASPDVTPGSRRLDVAAGESPGLTPHTRRFEMSNSKRIARGNYAPKRASRAARAAAFRERNGKASTLAGLTLATRSVSQEA